MKFTVVGSGAIGGTLGAYMARGGENVEFVDNARDHVEAMKARGLTIRGYGETFALPVKALHPEEVAGPLDVVLLAVKAQHTEAAVRSLLPHVGPETAIVSLQNGLCERTISQLVGPERTVGAFVNFSADYLEPGIIQYGSTGALYLGELNGKATPRLRAIGKALGHWGTVRLTENIWGYLWAKMGYANMLYATALADETMADVVDRYRELVVELACETYDVAALEGVKPEPFDAIEPQVYHPREERDWPTVGRSLDRMVAWMRGSEKTKSGIWRDLAVRHRKTEVDQHIGMVAEVGVAHGLPMTLTRRLVDLIHELENSTRQMSWDNVEELEQLRLAARREPEKVGELMESGIDSYLARNRQRHLDELYEYLRIPSVSALPENGADVRRAGRWVAEQLRAAGVETVEILETGGNPVVYGEWLGAQGTPTVLIYGHYDVQPPDPLDKWETPPFEPSVRDGRLYARGVSDDKAPMFQTIKVVEALLAVAGRLPLNVKFLFEGEEEVGSPNLRPFIANHTERLAADLVLSADGAMWRATEPSITVASKGLCGLEVHVTTARTDLHSGRHGGGVPNALHALAEIIAGLHDGKGRVAVPGFYDRVLPLSPAERAQFAALPFDEEDYRQDLEIEALVGEDGYTTLERQWTRPTLDCNGMWGGFEGEGSKTVIPCEAHAKITCRLVRDQNPEEVIGLVEEHIRRIAPKGARVRVDRLTDGALPYQIPVDLPALRAAGAALEEVMGTPAVYVRMGGTIPCAEDFLNLLGAYTLFFSFSTADEQFHAPNEFFRLDRFDTGLRAWATLLQALQSAL